VGNVPTEIAILDYGGQYVQNIRRAFLEMSISAEIFPPNSKLKSIGECVGVILSGGPYSVYQDSAPTIDDRVLRSRKPILGLCYGHQLIAHKMGGEVSRGKAGEYGFAEIRMLRKTALFEGIQSPQICWMSHGDQVARLPKGFVSLASTRDCPHAAMVHESLPVFGLQFHPEVSHTPQGWRMLQNFASEVCGLKVGSWDPESYIRSKITRIAAEVGKGKAMVAVSGGVDSTVTAVLARKALGERLITVHVDHGFMRENESEQVLRDLGSLGLETMLVDASKRFMDSVAGVEDGNAKRRKVGELFVRTFEEVANRKDVTVLIQGTIAPDAIESSRGMASKRRGAEHGGMIKLHHNVGGLPEEMWIQVVEPIRDLFKYQVRLLGKALGVPDGLLERQPFPGPGLCVRIGGAVTAEATEALRKATTIVEKSLGPYKPAQYLVYMIGREGKRHPEAERIAREMMGPSYSISASLHPNLGVGVKGDERLLGSIVSLRIQREGKLAWDLIPWLDLLRLQSAITGGLPDVCRVLAALGQREEGGMAAVIRSVDTRDFMTAMPSQIPFETLSAAADELLGLPSIGAVFYEMTTKPSSTIELE